MFRQRKYLFRITPNWNKNVVIFIRFIDKIIRRVVFRVHKYKYLSATSIIFTLISLGENQYNRYNEYGSI